MDSLVYISETRVRELLNWDQLYECIKCAMGSVSEERAFQNKRPVLKLGNTNNLLFSMCGFLSNKQYGGLGCKLFTYFPENFKQNEPALKANIFLLDEDTGNLKAIVAAAHITDWRTAAASVVATTYLRGNKDNKILAILGAGNQGKAHAMAFQHFFNFSKIRIWNRTNDRARKVIDEFNRSSDPNNEIFVLSNTVEECVKDADVIITATAGDDTFLKLEWLKKDVHINAIRVNPVNRELEDAIYKSSDVYVDYWEGAENELWGIKNLGVDFKAQIGDLVSGRITTSNNGGITVFQSLGMAVEDCAAARLVYDLHTKTSL